MPILDRCFCLLFRLCCGFGWRTFGHQDRADAIFVSSFTIFGTDQTICYGFMEQFRAIRRKDRTWDDVSARKLLDEGEYGFLAMCGEAGYGYGLPLSYVVDGDHIYFHCAPEGAKLDAIRANDRVSFCVVGDTQVIPQHFTTAYQSVHLFGRIAEVPSEEERLHALRLLVRKYSPDYVEIAEKYIAGSFHRTQVLRLDIEHLSGKCKRIPPQH